MWLKNNFKNATVCAGVVTETGEIRFFTWIKVCCYMKIQMTSFIQSPLFMQCIPLMTFHKYVLFQTLNEQTNTMCLYQMLEDLRVTTMWFEVTIYTMYCIFLYLAYVQYKIKYMGFKKNPTPCNAESKKDDL